MPATEEEAGKWDIIRQNINPGSGISISVLEMSVATNYARNKHFLSGCLGYTARCRMPHSQYEFYIPEC